MNTIIGELGKSPKFCEYIKSIENKTSPITISGLTDVGMLQIGVALNTSKKTSRRYKLFYRQSNIFTQKRNSNI